jgi:type II secretory pathway pseudopilin PulG
MIQPTRRRGGYTLLEVLLAAAIAIVLMAALYSAMNSQLRVTQEARYAVEQGALVRSLVARMAGDMSANLGPAPAPTSSSSTGSSSATGSTSSTGSTTSDASSSSSSSSTGSTSFNLGVVGDASRVVLYASRALRPGQDFPIGNTNDITSTQSTCDLRRITYWLAQGSGGATGLARQELRNIGDDAAMSTIPPDVPDESSYVIAEEVKSLLFSYFDGTQWTDSWDANAAGSDGTTPLGPPAAIAFEMAVQLPGSSATRTIRHVVALQTANGQGTADTSSTSGGR